MFIGVKVNFYLVENVARATVVLLKLNRFLLGSIQMLLRACVTFCTKWKSTLSLFIHDVFCTVKDNVLNQLLVDISVPLTSGSRQSFQRSAFSPTLKD